MAKILPSGQIQVTSGDTASSLSKLIFGNTNRAGELLKGGGFGLGDVLPYQVSGGGVGGGSASKSVQYQQGGWYDNPATGKNQRWWDGAFLPVGQSEPTKNTSSVPQGNDPAADFINSIIDEITKPLKEATDRAGKFDENNPFAFDEALARASAEERLSPYYDAELKDYLSGVERSRGRTIQDQEALKKELLTTKDETTERVKQRIEDTVAKTQEGFADAGLLNSGAEERAVGQAKIAGQDTLEATGKNVGDQVKKIDLNASRALEDLTADQSTFQRKLGAEKETSLQTDVLTQKKEAQQRHELERQQFIGGPLATGMSSLSSLYGIG